MEPARHIFGPVPSRRLGLSLGVDLVPYKTCTFNCIYCQLGQTTRRQMWMRAYVTAERIAAELEAYFASDRPRPDYVTLSGSGEPTLNAALGDIITAIKSRTNVPIALLTNGSLFWDAGVREACALTDVVLPTLAACNEAQFQQVHRPADGLTLARHLAGLAAFTREHATPMWLELFLIEGVNASESDLPAFANLIERIGPARVQLNTAVRPTTEEDVIAVSPSKLAAWAAALGPTAEVIADFAHAPSGTYAVEASSVLSMCQRRPCTLDDVASGLSLHPAQASKLLTELLSAGRVRSSWRDRREYFVGA